MRKEEKERKRKKTDGERKWRKRKEKWERKRKEVKMRKGTKMRKNKKESEGRERNKKWERKRKEVMEEKGKNEKEIERKIKEVPEGNESEWRERKTGMKCKEVHGGGGGCGGEGHSEWERKGVKCEGWGKVRAMVKGVYGWGYARCQSSSWSENQGKDSTVILRVYMLRWELGGKGMEFHIYSFVEWLDML
jgi:hypothetical protein